ncbi:MAG: alpha-L-fucosidase [Verrucomicrobia bacterium]|nr:alpha-L-fucosidase [Verrucomicrobiota bacterium]
MKKAVRQLMGAVLFAAAATAADQPASKGPTVHSDALPRPTAEQAQWQDYEIGVFYHYDMNAFKPGWDHRKYDDFPKPEIFNPTRLDTNQWMEVPKALGAKYAVLTATHGSGFMLWQSDAYPYGLKQSPWKIGKGDIVKEFVDSCRNNGVSPGIYCHMRVNGWWQVDHPGFVKRGQGGDDALQAKYAAAKIQQVKELWGKYGPLAEIWIDGGLPDPKAGYVLEGKVGETWQIIGGGTCIGHKRIERITPVEVAAVRLNVLKSAATPLIRKLAVYHTQAS